MNIKGLKTLGFAALLAAFGVLQTADWISLVGEENSGYVLIVIAAIVAGLRAVTSTPIGKSE